MDEQRRGHPVSMAPLAEAGGAAASASTDQAQSLGLEVVIPVRDGAPYLGRCLDGLLAAGAGVGRIVVVDDASWDGTAALADARGVRVVRHRLRKGAAAARNSGVAASRARLILFVDVDVVVHPDLFCHIRRGFADPGVDAIFGSYDAEPAAPGLVSQYRNLLHHFTHQHAGCEAGTFWTGCGAIRRAALLAVGGFDPSLSSMEDIDLGMRLRAAGWRIRLEPGLLCTHLKRWSLAEMIRTDLLHRAIPWSRLLLARSEALPDDLNLDRGQRRAVASTGILAGALALAAWWPVVLWLALLAAAGVLVENRRFFAFLLRVRGAGFAVAAFPLHVVHHASAGLGFAIALVEHTSSRAIGRSGAGGAVRRIIARQ